MLGTPEAWHSVFHDAREAFNPMVVNWQRRRLAVFR